MILLYRCEKTKIENTEKSILLNIIKEELRRKNSKLTLAKQKEREIGLDSSALAILNYDFDTARELINSYLIRRKIEKF